MVVSVLTESTEDRKVLVKEPEVTVALTELAEGKVVPEQEPEEAEPVLTELKEEIRDLG